MTNWILIGVALLALWLIVLSPVILLLYAHGEREREDELVTDGGHDLAGDERPGELKIRLACTGPCKPSRTIPYRKPDDPESVVRCRRCGKRHSRDSLEVIEP